MTGRPKDIGTAAETAVVRFLRDNGFPLAERRALHGSTDRGDITGTPGLVWEVKGGDAAKTASDNQIAAWLDETEIERANANAAYGFLVVARRLKNVRDWWAVLWTDAIANLCCGDGVRPEPVPVRLTLAGLVAMLDGAGWTDDKAHQAPEGES